MDAELVIAARAHDVGGLVVGRVLPSPRRRMVGPFLFLDEMGPVERPPGHQKDRLEEAKQAWRDGRFPKVPGDAIEFIPLPG